MRCSKCGQNVGLILKFCPKCGTAVTPGQRKKGLITFGIWALVFILLVPVIYFVAGKYSPELQNKPNLDIFFTALILSFLATCALIVIYTLISSIVRFVIRYPILGSIIIGIILLLAGFARYLYISDVNAQKFSDSVAVIQENVNEAAAAKIMGDSIIAKKAVPGASMVRVKAAAELVAGRLEFMSVPKGLSDYQQSIIVWSNAISKAADDNKLWASVGDHPGDFRLALGQKQSDALFQDSVNKITELKEFGDSAINRKDKVTMVYIAAKLVTQEHWLNGILHSTPSGFLSFNLFPTALAAFENVPPVGSGTDVTCQVCNDPNIKWTAQLRSQYGCDTKCKGSSQQQNQQLNKLQNNGGQTQTQNNTNKPTQPTPNNTNNNTQVTVTTNNKSDSPYSYGDTAPRKICIGNNANGVFCVEDAVQSVNEIEASTIGFAEGKKGATDDWNNGWHKEGGLGVISQTPTNNSAGQSPAVQAFYNDCKGKGGIVGGAGTVKSGLPTTESGYTCEFKIKDNGGASVPCWDFMTYSGGRYMGGNNGCQEENLVPKIDDQTMKDKTAGLGGRWDGVYSLSGTTIKCSGDFAYAIPVPAVTTMVRNNIMSSTQGPLPINGNTVVWTMSISNQQENAVVSVSEIDTFRFNQSGSTTGVIGTYNANITVSTADQVKVSSCYGSIGGSRK